MKMLRMRPMLDKGGRTKTPVYRDIGAGLWPRGVKLGAREVAWPEHEIDAVLAARTAGQTDEQVKALVQRLHEARARGVPA